MQSADEPLRSGKLPGLYRVMADSIRQEGWPVMFRGLWPTIVR